MLTSLSVTRGRGCIACAVCFAWTGHWYLTPVLLTWTQIELITTGPSPAPFHSRSQSTSPVTCLNVVWRNGLTSKLENILELAANSWEANGLLYNVFIWAFKYDDDDDDGDDDDDDSDYNELAHNTWEKNGLYNIFILRANLNFSSMYPIRAYCASTKRYKIFRSKTSRAIVLDLFMNPI